MNVVRLVAGAGLPRLSVSEGSRGTTKAPCVLLTYHQAGKRHGLDDLLTSKVILRFGAGCLPLYGQTTEFQTFGCFGTRWIVGMSCWYYTKAICVRPGVPDKCQGYQHIQLGLAPFDPPMRKIGARLSTL